MHLSEWEIFSTGIHNSEDSAGKACVYFGVSSAIIVTAELLRLGGVSAVKKLMGERVCVNYCV
jgi:hypothetical protein